MRQPRGDSIEADARSLLLDFTELRLEQVVMRVKHYPKTTPDSYETEDAEYHARTNYRRGALGHNDKLIHIREQLIGALWMKSWELPDIVRLMGCDDLAAKRAVAWVKSVESERVRAEKRRIAAENKAELARRSRIAKANREKRGRKKPAKQEAA